MKISQSFPKSRFINTDHTKQKMTEGEILGLQLAGGFLVLLIAVQVFAKLNNIESERKGSYYKACLFVAKKFNLAEVKLTYAERRDRVNHLERLNYRKLGSKEVYSVFEGSFQSVDIELLEFGKSRSINQDTGVFAQFNSNRSVWLAHNILPFRLKSYKDHQSTSFLHKYTLVRNPQNSIWSQLSETDLQRLNGLLNQYRKFEIIIQNGRFYFWIPNDTVPRDSSLRSNYERKCAQIRLIVDMALELRSMFETAAMKLDTQDELSWPLN